MRLVDHQETAATPDLGQHLGAELRVGQPLGRDQQQVDGVSGELFQHAVPVVTVGAVDCLGAHPHPLSRLDLVAHERQQRRDQQSRPAAPVPQHAGRNEVHGALAPPGALHQQHPLAPPHQPLDRLELVRPEVRPRIPGEPSAAAPEPHGASVSSDAEWPPVATFSAGLVIRPKPTKGVRQLYPLGRPRRVCRMRERCSSWAVPREISGPSSGAGGGVLGA